MSEQDQDQASALIENSKQLIARLNQLLERAGAPIRFAEMPVADHATEDKPAEVR